MNKKYIPECLICFNNIHKYPYVYCNICDTYVHKKCYLSWVSFSGNKLRQCIHCQTYNSLFFYDDSCFKKCYRCLF